MQTHVRNLLAKLRVHSRLEAVVLVEHNGGWGAFFGTADAPQRTR